MLSAAALLNQSAASPRQVTCRCCATYHVHWPRGQLRSEAPGGRGSLAAGTGSELTAEATPVLPPMPTLAIRPSAAAPASSGMATSTPTAIATPVWNDPAVLRRTLTRVPHR